MKKGVLIKAASVVVILAIGFFAMAALSSTDKKSNKRDIKPEVRAVETYQIHFGELTLSVEGNGVVNSTKTLNVVAEASGVVTYAKNDLKDGTFVKEGEVILEIDSRETENRLYSLRSDFLNAIASLLPDMKIENDNSYDKWYTYFVSLDIEQNVPDLPDAETSKEKMKLSTRDIYTKYFSVKTQEILLSKHQITAPFSGYITSNGIIENSFVRTGQHLVTVTDAINLEISVPLLVDEFNMIDFSKSPEVTIISDNAAHQMSGRILRKETNIARNSQTINVFVGFTNYKLDPYFLPGNYVKVAIDGEQMNDVALIPRYTIDNESNVYTMEEGKLNRQEIEVVARQGDQTIIRRTLPEGTKLVTTILQKPLIGMALQSVNDPDPLPESAEDSVAKAKTDEEAAAAEEAAM